MNANKLFTELSMKKIWDKLTRHDEAFKTKLLVLSSGNWVAQDDGTFTNTVSYAGFKETDNVCVDLHDDGTLTDTQITEYEQYIDRFKVIDGGIIAYANTLPTTTLMIVVRGEYEYLVDGTDSVKAMITDAYSDEKEYETGDLCIKDNTLIKFTADKGIGAWDDTVAETTTINKEFSLLNSNMGGLSGLLTSDNSSLVNAINEVFQNAGESKINIVTALTGIGMSLSFANPDDPQIDEILIGIQSYKALKTSTSYQIYPNDSNGIVGSWSGVSEQGSFTHSQFFDATPFRSLTISFFFGMDRRSDSWSTRYIYIKNSSGTTVASTSITKYNGQNGNYSISINLSNIKEDVRISSSFDTNHWGYEDGYLKSQGTMTSAYLST